MQPPAYLTSSGEDSRSYLYDLKQLYREHRINTMSGERLRWGTKTPPRRQS
jgi:hypothetical protein